MEYRQLGNTSINVSRLSFGCLCMGYLQHNLTHEQGGELILRALDLGINFYDTAQFYQTYDHIRYAVEHGAKDLQICTKSYAYDTAGAEQALREAFEKTKKDVIDVFLIHETESIHTIRGHYEALEYYIRMKEKGYIKAVGVSTHFVGAVKAASNINEIDVIEPIINKNGIGIVGGTLSEMEDAIRQAHDNRKGLIAMKVLGGGNLYRNALACYDYINNLYGIDTILTGMVRFEEIENNVKYFEGKLNHEEFFALADKEKKLHIDDWCVGCGDCIVRCKSSALSLIDGKVQVNHSLCVRCGYCSSACKEMVLKII